MEERIPGELEVLLSRGIPKSTVMSAYRLAADYGMTPAEYLVRNALVSIDAVYSAFAEYCGVPFLPERGFRPQSLNDRALQFGDPDHGPLLISLHNNQVHYAIAPGYDQFQAVYALLKRFPDFARRVRIASPSAMLHASSVLNGPSGDLRSRFPDLSAHLRISRGQRLAVLLILIAMFLGMSIPMFIWFYVICGLLALICMASGIARFASALATWQDRLTFELPKKLSDPNIIWPRYTVLVPLYREARVAPSLVKTLQQLDYPVDRLQILFLVELDDYDTYRAFAGLLPAHMDVIRVPQGAPKTKPRALAHGLQLATGDYVTIFDAEDRPEPDQLKKAALMFSLAPKELACIQARLAIDNDGESFFTRQFALEYACLFDQLIPWFHRNNWPFPLGGTSNHFRRAALERVGGWDKYNVTEDADLGVRLARFGYRSGVLASATYEEAPIVWRGWFAQRARWYKGWLQTILVHSRDPARIGQEIGWGRLGALSSMFVGSLFLIALHPVFFLILLGYAAGLIALPFLDTQVGAVFLAFCAAAALIGYTGAAAAAWLAALKRGLRPDIGDLLSIPFYWFCTGIAFYRASWEFVFSPYQWNKTEHGLSKVRKTF